MSDSLRPHGLWHSRLPCHSLSPGVCSNSSSLSWWYYLTISSSTAPFSFCLASLSYASPIANNKAVIHEGNNRSGNILFLKIVYYFWLHHVAYKILVPKPRMEPIHPAMETQSLNHWALREIREKSLVVESDLWWQPSKKKIKKNFFPSFFKWIQ